MCYMNWQSKKQTVLLITDCDHDLTDLYQILSKRYQLIYAKDGAHDFMRIKKEAGTSAAAVICAAVASRDNYVICQGFQNDNIFTGLPILIYCSTETDFAAATEGLKHGAVDIISPPLYDNIIFQRIENAIRLKASITFFEIEHMLKALPSNIYLKDDKGRYVFATHYWRQLKHSDDPNWTIRGKTDLEIRKDKENAEKAYQTDLEILKTGLGKRYIIEVNIEGRREFLELIKEPVKNSKGKVKGIIALINDVTEKEKLRMHLEESALTDELTGLLNNNAYSRQVYRLENEIKAGCANFGLVIIDLNFLKYINDTYGHEQGNRAIKTISVLICNVFKHSPVFRFGGDEFIIILEKSDLDQYFDLRNEFFIALETNRKNTSLAPWEQVSAAIGIAIFDKNVDKSVADVFARADRNMYACKKSMRAIRCSDSPQ